MGSLAATYVLEEHGTQRHRYSLANFEQRYGEVFGDQLPLDLAWERPTARAASLATEG